MKPSTLASYLESLAGLIRSCRPGESLPRVQVKAGPRPSLDMSGTRVAGPLPIPSVDAEGLAFLVSCFPGIVGLIPHANAEASAQDLAHQVDDLTATARNLRTMADRYAVERDEARKHRDNAMASLLESRATIEQLTRDLEALRRTVDRMRVAPSVTVAPAPAQRHAPAPVPGDLLSDILRDTESDMVRAQREMAQDRPRPHFTITPVVLAFPPNAQGKTLAAAAVTLDEVRALFTFKFIDSRDASKGGYWLAKDPTAPAVHSLVATLEKHGAFTRDNIPVFPSAHP